MSLKKRPFGSGAGCFPMLHLKTEYVAPGRHTILRLHQPHNGQGIKAGAQDAAMMPPIFAPQPFPLSLLSRVSLPCSWLGQPNSCYRPAPSHSSLRAGYVAKRHKARNRCQQCHRLYAAAAALAASSALLSR